MRIALTELGIGFNQEHRDGVYLIDFFLPSLNVALEADGTYWHNLPKHKANDKRRDDYFLKKGITTIRITESELRGVRAKEAQELVLHKLFGAA